MQSFHTEALDLLIISPQPGTVLAIFWGVEVKTNAILSLLSGGILVGAIASGCGGSEVAPRTAGQIQTITTTGTNPSPTPTPAPGPTIHTMVTSASNDIETRYGGWPTSNLIDGSATTVYSSVEFASSTNDRNTFVAAWMATQQTITSLHLKARVDATTGGVLGFPESYDVYLVNVADTGWEKIGTFTGQPDATGLARIDFAHSYVTKGVQIIPVKLGMAGTQYRLQLAEINLVTYPTP